MSETTPSVPPDGTAGSPTILIVEDDRDLADTYARWLSDEYDVETVYNGVQARNRIRDELDLVLLDRRMPGVPGDRVLENIRERDVDCPVAMLTAVEPDTDIIDLPFDEYLVKPVTQSQLRETVDDLLLRNRFGSDARDYFAMAAKTETLGTRDEANLRDPQAAADLRADTERARESERIQDLESQLQRLRRLSSVIRDIDQQLVVATSREEIERTVCERLVDADPYELAWISDYTVSFERTTPRALAGPDGVSLDDGPLDGDDRGPIPEAVSTGEVQVVEDFSTGRGRRLLAPVLPENERPRVTAGAVVPLIYRDTVYGVLNVCVDGADVFDEREVEVLSELGDSIANAINSVESKKLMLSDTLVELEFDVWDRADVFVSLSAETDSRIELKGFVPVADGELTSYLEVTKTTTEAFLDTATGRQEVRKVRGLDESSVKNLYECRVSGPTVVLSLIEAGANVESMQIEAGQGHVTASVAPETDVRTVVETVRERFGDVDLIGKREVARDLQSTEDFRQSLENRLTDRQYSILEAVYSAGYFDWPRGSTAKEIADSLELAPPTLHEHLRSAQKELIETFFEETGKFEGDERPQADE
jgi:predicted DNA binding protein/DNA-binding response OmpR family regulator